MADSLEKLIEKLSFRVRLFIETTGSGITDELINERDLTFLEYLEEKGDTGFSEIASFFKKISPSTVSNTLKKLHLKGLVSRREDPDDLRTKIFSLTEEGRHTLTPIKQNQTELFHLIAEALNVTPDEMEVVMAIIGRAIENFNFWLGLANLEEVAEPDNKP